MNKFTTIAVMSAAQALAQINQIDLEPFQLDVTETYEMKQFFGDDFNSWIQVEGSTAWTENEDGSIELEITQTAELNDLRFDNKWDTMNMTSCYLNAFSFKYRCFDTYIAATYNNARYTI